MAITRREAKEIVDYVVREVHKRSFVFSTDGKVDLSKSVIGTVSGTLDYGGTIANAAIYDRHVHPSANITGTKIQQATTSNVGVVQLAADLDTASSEAVQGNDSRLHTAAVANATDHDGRYYTETEIGADTGATLVGIANPSGWWVGDNVMTALNELNQRKLTSLSDVPNSYEGMGGDVLMVRVDELGIEFGEYSAGGGVSTFSGLIDTPNLYQGYQGYSVVVNDTEDGLDYVLISGAEVSGVNFNPHRSFYLVPEYPNSVIIETGNSSGILNTSYDDVHSYYDWIGYEETNQDVDIVARFLLPPDFLEFEGGIYMWNKSDSAGSGGVRLAEFLDSNSNNVITPSTALNTSWTETEWEIPTSGTWSVNTFVTAKIKLIAEEYKHVRLGELRIPYIIKDLDTNIIWFCPEYDGYITEFNSAETDGVLTALNTGGHNAFQLTNDTEIVNIQDIDIVVRFLIPPDFVSMANNFYMYSQVYDSLGDSGVRLVELLDTAGTNVITPLTMKNESWYQDVFPMSAGTWTIGSYGTIRFRLLAEYQNWVRLGEAKLYYNTE